MSKRSIIIYLFYVLLVLCFYSTSVTAIMSSTVQKGVCAVFGYGPGLGAAVARKWSCEGYKVAIMSRTMEKLLNGEKDIDNCKGYACDVTQPDDIKKTVDAIESDLGPITCLIYNAGSGVWKTWDVIPLDDFDKGYQTNVKGLLAATQQIAPKMLQRTEYNNCILITGATASLRGKPFTAGFAPHKGSQRLLAQALARDLGPKGIHVGYFIIDGGIGKGDGTDINTGKLDPNAIADTYYNVAQQPKTCWSFETEVRPSVENW